MSLARLILAASLLVFTTSLAPASELFDTCAANAASKYEPGYETTGPIDVGSFYAYDAIESCTLALAEDPANSQLMAWLGNAYAADNQPAKAVPLLEPAAAAGNMVAQRALGDLLILGKGIGQDKIRGTDLLQQSAQQGFAPAALSLGYSFEFGDGVAADPAAAMEWYTKAADAGVTRAQLIVAKHYQEGNGVPADAAAAFGWLQRAAEANNPEAQYRLGVAYLEGRGVAQSSEQALATFETAAENYSAEGSTALGYMYELGLSTDVDLDKAVDAYSVGRVANWRVGVYDYARLAEVGVGFEATPENARTLYEHAARAGEMRAAVNLALMLLEGRGGPQDLPAALMWTRRAADAGNAAALNNLGRIYELGLGVEADPAEARRLYGEAAALGYELAADNLAQLDGRGERPAEREDGQRD